MTDLTFKKGDRLPAVQATLLDRDGDAVDLTGATVLFLMRNQVTKAVKVNAAATLVNAALGIVSYAWAAADLDTAGFYEAEFEVTLAGLKQTYPNDRFINIEVVEDVA
jgi:BppU N-terminal domain